jgi:hypothetical protein
MLIIAIEICILKILFVSSIYNPTGIEVSPSHEGILWSIIESLWILIPTYQLDNSEFLEIIWWPYF